MMNCSFRLPRISRSCLRGLAALALTAWSWPICSQVGLANDSEPQAEITQHGAYRRIFVPANEPDKWPVGSERYLPIPASVFSKMIEEQRQGRFAVEKEGVRLTKVSYTAELAADDILHGHADCVVDLASSNPKLLPLAPLNLAVSSASWNRDRLGAVAKLGLWDRGENRQELGVLVNQSGSLRLDWELRARSSNSTSSDYLLRAPIAATQEIALVLPKDHSAEIPSGALISTELLQEDKQRWIFQLAPEDSHQIKVTRQTQTPRPQALPRVGSTTTYRLDPEGLTFVASLRIEPVGTRNREVRFVLSSGARVLSAKIDNQSVRWQTEETTGGTQLVIERPPSQVPQTVEIEGFAQMQFDQAWQLPALRAQEVFWTEGTVSLVVSPEIELTSLIPRQANVQDIVGIQTDAASEETVRLQEWSSDASLEVVVRRRQSQVRVRSVTTIDLDPDDLVRDETQSNETTARTVAQIECTDRSTYRIEAELSSGWKIESVNTAPQDALREWHLLPASTDSRRELIHIQLNAPLNPGTPLNLELNYRANTQGTLFPVSLGELTTQRFLNAKNTSQWLLLRSQARNQMELLHGLNRALRNVDDLDQPDKSLLPEPQGGLLIDGSHLNADSIVEIRSRKSEYRANVNVEINALPDSFKHRFLLECSPISGAVSQIVLHSHQPLPESIQWELVGRRGGIVAERLDQLSGGPSYRDEGATYLLRLPVAFDQPFQLLADYSSAGQDAHRCNFPDLPEASDWSGQVVIRGSLEGFSIDDRGWTPLPKPVETSAEKGNLPVIGCYRLEPDRYRNGPENVAITVRRTSPSIIAADVVAWLADVQTLKHADGGAIYVVSYYLENSRATSIEVELPANVELQEAWVGQEQLEPQEVLTDEYKCKFRIPDQQRFLTVGVQYFSQGPALGRSTKVRPELPNCSFPIKLGRWTLSLPEQYKAESLTPAGQASEYSWRQRLFGPVARLPHATVFNPFRAESWSQLLSSNTSQNRGFGRNAELSNNFEGWHTPEELIEESDKITATHSAFSPWSGNHSASRLAGLGQNTVRVEYINFAPEIVVRHAVAERAKWYAIWFLGLILGTWLVARSPSRIMLAAAFLAAACLILPTSCVAEFQAAFLGLLSGGILKVVLRQLNEDVPTSSIYSWSTRSIAIVALLGSFLVSDSSFAEPTSALRDELIHKEHVELHRVLVPLDAKGASVGNDVYVSESFMSELRGIAGKRSPVGSQCVLTHAIYRGSMPVGHDGTVSFERSWSLIFEIESYVSNSQLYLPLQRDEATWLAELHRLDGLPIAIEWSQHGIGCTVSLGEAGTHRLELFVDPKVVSSTRGEQIQLHIPPLAGARLELDGISGVQNLQINSAGRMQVDPTNGRGRAVLAATELLELNWKSTHATEESEKISVVEQLVWLHVEPSAALLDVRLSFQTTEALPKIVTLEISPQLKLMPLDEEAPIDSIEESSAEPQRIKLRLKDGLGAQTLVPLQFQLQRTASLGRMMYPWIRLQNGEITRSLFAVSVSSELSYDETLSGELRSLPAREFSDAWGTDDEPLFAYSSDNEVFDGSLRIWPNPQTMTVQQSIQMHCELSHTHIEYEAAVEEVFGSMLIHRLTAPEEFEVEEVFVARRGESQVAPVRWSRANNSELMVFLSQPFQEGDLLKVRGGMNVSPEGKLTLPRLSLIGAGLGDVHLDVYREPGIRVEGWNFKAAPPGVAQQGRPPDRNNILVGHIVWRPSESMEPEMLRIEKNNPAFSAETLTAIVKQENGWNSTLHAHISVQEGVLSQVTVEAPSTFQGPFEVLPEGVGVVDEIVETAAGREITLLLFQPVTAENSIDLHITAGLSLPTDQRLEIPNLRLTEARQEERYISLPRRFEEKNITWDLEGLATRPLPSGFSKLARLSENAGVYFVAQERFLAREHSYHGPLDRAALRYAFVLCDLDQHGNYTASAELVLQPGRATHCKVRLPPQSQLLQLIVGDQRVRREAINDQDWLVSLGPPFLPRKIKAIYRSKIDLSDGRMRLTPPTLLIGDLPLPKPHTRWEINPVGGLRLEHVLVGNHLVEEQFVRATHQLPLEVLADSRLLALELPLQEGRAWFFPWQQDIQEAWNNWRAIEPSARTIGGREPAILGSDLPADKQADDWTALTEKLGTSPEALVESVSGSAASYPPRLQFKTASTPKYFLSNELGVLELSYVSTFAVNVWRWFFAAVLISSSLSLYFFLLKVKSGWHEEVGARPYVMAVAAGLIWWLLLRPSALGLLAVVLAIALLIYRQAIHWWRRRVQVANTQFATSSN